MTTHLSELFGPVVSSYTRKDALADGVLIDVSSTAVEAGIKYPVAVTAEVYAKYIVPSPREESFGQDLDGRLWDTVWMLRNAIAKNKGLQVLFPVIYATEQKHSNHLKHKTIKLKAICGPGDEGEPVITVMLPEQS